MLKLKVIGLVCSPRRKRHTFDFVDLTLKKLKKKKLDVELLYLRDYELKPCLLCDAEESYPCLDENFCPRKDDTAKLHDKLNVKAVKKLADQILERLKSLALRSDDWKLFNNSVI
jgi:hypothetical protein